jgi:hypothetical protein
VPDILDQIDAAIDQRCTCGCGAKLRPNGPSAYFAGEDCQQRWRCDQLDPERARRRAERTAQRRLALAERAAISELIRTAYTTTPDRERVAAAMRQAEAILTEMANRLRPVFEAIARAGEELARQWAPVLAAQGITPEPTSLRERALAHVHNRNTGPPIPQRAPRRIDPRRSR